jgi:manganese/zinc/iron transport system permease protein
MDAFWIILTGCLVATCGSVLGSYLLLRRQTLLTDAISHAVLPGIVVAFLLSGSREPFTMLIGASALGLITTLSIEWLTRRGGLAADAATGLTYTLLFAIGIILLTAFAADVDLDQDCVLYGEITYVPLDTFVTGGGLSLGPRAVWMIGGVLLVSLLYVALAYKELLITTFDPAYATTLGLSVGVWHYALMALVSASTVAAFESVGAIVVVALMVAPPATGFLLAKRLPQMMAIATAAGVAAAIGGYSLAAAFDVSVAGAMATVAGVLFVAALVYDQYRSRQRDYSGDYFKGSTLEPTESGLAGAPKY